MVRRSLPRPLVRPVAARLASAIAAASSAVLAAGLLVPLGAAPAAAEVPNTGHVRHTSWTSVADFRTGRLKGVRAVRGSLRLRPAKAQPRRFQRRAYDSGTWISPWVAPGFALTELIPSWQARTPRDSWIEVQVRGRAADGRRSSWDTVARWTSGEKALQRTSGGSQDDDLGRLAVDTWRTDGVTRWQLRVRLMRRAGSRIGVALHRIGAVASDVPAIADVATSRPTRRVGSLGELAVPRFSQMTHSGHSPQWGGGGEAWCSPTSASMVLAYWDSLPDPRSWAWVGAGHGDPWVDEAARRSYDHGYDGTGNWAFTTAFAGSHVEEAYVTRLRSLREAEAFIAQGVPLVASIAFGRGELAGAPISSSNGHLLVITGFEADGDVVVNDPAAASNGTVRRVYDRAQFEDAWIPASRGTVYVIRD